MSRLIDADKLIEICRKGWKLFGREDEKLKHWVDEDDIRNQPTVDAVPVIRCKDCKHRVDVQFSGCTLHFCTRFDEFNAHPIDDLERFCSWAERKEE